jgi:NAD(P)-dependent dehydrogenase (short-subunit alcohol dehydrogenase family)
MNLLTATLTGIADLWRQRRTIPALGADERIDGQVALVTGASSGLGFATAVDLARRGAAVLMADCRAVPAAVARARRLSGSDRLEGLHVDLADLGSIARLADELAARATVLDLLVLNAGIVPAVLRTTPQGLNEMFVVNYLSSFVLLTGLLDAGLIRRAGGETDAAAAIIFVSSEAHRWATDLDLSDLGRRPDYSLSTALGVYGYYKLMTTTLAQELDRRLNPDGRRRVSVSSLCPGAMNTNIAREAPALVRPLLGVVMRLFFQDPFAADEPILYLACSRHARRRTGLYLHRMVEKQVDRRARDPETGRMLWDQSEALLRRVWAPRPAAAGDRPAPRGEADAALPRRPSPVGRGGDAEARHRR